MFVYDGSFLPSTKTDVAPYVGDPTLALQASEFNTITSASYDIRTALTLASYFGYATNSTASVPLFGAKTRFSGTLQAAFGQTGEGWRDIPLVSSGTLQLGGDLRVSGSVTGSGATFSANITVQGSITASADLRAQNLQVANSIIYFGGVTNGAYFQAPNAASLVIGTSNAPRVTVSDGGLSTTSITGTMIAVARDIQVTGSFTGSGDATFGRNLNAINQVTVGAGGFYGFKNGHTNELTVFANGANVVNFNSAGYLDPENSSIDLGQSGNGFRDGWFSRTLSSTGAVTSSLPYAAPSSTTAAGNATVNKPFGRSILAASSRAVRILNSMVTTGSFVHITPENWDPTMTTWSVSASAGFFDVSGSAAATRDWQFTWQVFKGI